MVQGCSAKLLIEFVCSSRPGGWRGNLPLGTAMQAQNLEHGFYNSSCDGLHLKRIKLGQETITRGALTDLCASLHTNTNTRTSTYTQTLSVTHLRALMFRAQMGFANFSMSLAISPPACLCSLVSIHCCVCVCMQGSAAYVGRDNAVFDVPQLGPWVGEC